MTALEEIKKAFPNMFRPLKWHHFDGPTEHGCGEWYAHATRGMYHIYDVREKFPNDRPFYAKELSDQFDKLEQAQDAVQNRHELDIVMCLDPDFLSTLESLQRENEELNAWKDGVLAAAHLITFFADDMNERNLDDKRAYIKQQTGRIRAALHVAYVCAADMELLGKSSDGWDFSMSPKPRPDLGMNMALYAAPLTEASKRDPVLWVSPVDLRAWQKAKAGEIWAWSENLEGECIPLYTALASTGGEHHAE